MIPTSLRRSLLFLLLLMSIGSIFFASATGSVSLGWQEWLAAIQDSSSRYGDLIWRLRLPRAVAAWVVGSMLAMSGCLMQVLLRNPLADPYVLGVSGGAAFATLLGMVFGRRREIEPPSRRPMGLSTGSLCPQGSTSQDPVLRDRLLDPHATGHLQQ